MSRSASGRAAAARLVWHRASLPLRLRLLPIDDVLRGLTPDEAPRTGSVPPQVERWVVWSEWLLARVPVRSTCLFRSLARYAALRHAGVSARFVMGVEPGGDDMTGHAWIEVGGQPWRERLEARFVETFSWPPP